MNLRKQKSNFAVGGMKRSNRTSRSQSIAAVGGGGGIHPKSKKSGR